MNTPACSASGINRFASREESITRILDVIRANDISRIYPVHDAREKLSTYSDSTIDIILEGALHKNQRTDLMIAAINEMDEHTVREAMYLHPYCSRETATAHHQLMGIIRGLHQLDHFKGASNLETLTGEDLLIAAAFINVTSALKRYFEHHHLTITSPHNLATISIHIGNHAAQKLIVENHSKAHIISDFLKDGISTYTQQALSGLPHVRWYKKQDINTVTEEDINHAIAYFRITAALISYTDYEHITRSGEDWTRTEAHLENEAFEDLIDQYHSKADAIIGYIEERETADPEALRDYLENGTVLKTGVL